MDHTMGSGGSSRDRRRARRLFERAEREAQGRRAAIQTWLGEKGLSKPQTWGELRKACRFGGLGSFFGMNIGFSGGMTLASPRKTSFLDAMTQEMAALRAQLKADMFARLYGYSPIVVRPGMMYVFPDLIIVDALQKRLVMVDFKVATPGDGQLLEAVRAAGGSASPTHAPVPGVRP